MAITPRTAQSGVTASGDTVTINKPVGVAENDLLVVLIQALSFEKPFESSDQQWEPLLMSLPGDGGTRWTYAAYRHATDSEPADYEFVFSGSSSGFLYIMQAFEPDSGQVAVDLGPYVRKAYTDTTPFVVDGFEARSIGLGVGLVTIRENSGVDAAVTLNGTWTEEAYERSGATGLLMATDTFSTNDLDDLEITPTLQDDVDNLTGVMMMLSEQSFAGNDQRVILPRPHITSVSTFGTSFVVPAPQDIVDDDLIIVAAALRDDDETIDTVPSGFTEQLDEASANSTNVARLAVFTKTASSESGDYTFETSGSIWAMFTCFVIKQGSLASLSLGSRVNSDTEILAATLPAVGPPTNDEAIAVSLAAGYDSTGGSEWLADEMSQDGHQTLGEYEVGRVSVAIGFNRKLTAAEFGEIDGGFLATSKVVGFQMMLDPDDGPEFSLATDLGTATLEGESSLVMDELGIVYEIVNLIPSGASRLENQRDRRGGMQRQIRRQARDE